MKRLRHFFSIRIFQEHAFLAYAFVFLFAFFVFLIFQWSVNFPDPDSFYHARMAELIRDEGVVFEFPWAHYTVLTRYYTNQHFLYHVLLIPFVTFLHPFVGLKISTAFFSALFVTAFFLFFRAARTRFPFLWTCLLLVTMPLMFRLSLAKAVSLSLFFLFLGLFFVYKKRYGFLFVWSFLYVWAYGGFPLLGVLSFIFVFFSVVFSVFRKRGSFREAAQVLLSIFFGFALGVLSSPYFPQNLLFYWQQTVQIGVVNFRDTIGVGGEWYPYGFFELLSGSLLLTFFAAGALLWFFLFLRRQNALSWSAFFWSVFFLVLTLKSRRYVEYYVPFATFFSAVVWTDMFSVVFPKAQHLHWNIHNLSLTLYRFFLKVQRWSFLQKCIAFIMLLYFCLIVPAVIFRDFQTNLADTHEGIPYDRFAVSMQWLAAHSETGDIVLHSDWDEFPILFYYNTKNYYIVGLDPTFMYQYDADLYWKWVNITTGKFEGDIYDIIHHDFHARFVFIENDHTAMKHDIASAKGFTLVYEDDEAMIYAVADAISSSP